MTPFIKYATALTSASILSLGIASAQVMDTDGIADPAEQEQEAADDSMQADDSMAEGEEADSEATAEAEAVATLTAPDATSMAEAQFAEADGNEDALLDEAEYATYTESVATVLREDYGVELDVRAETQGSGVKVDVTNSGSIAEMRANRDAANAYADAAEVTDKIDEAASTRFAAIANDGTIAVETLVTEAGNAFDDANSNDDEVLEGAELEAFGTAFTGLEIASADETMEQETGIEVDSDVQMEGDNTAG